MFVALLKEWLLQYGFLLVKCLLYDWFLLIILFAIEANDIPSFDADNADITSSFKRDLEL